MDRRTCNAGHSDVVIIGQFNLKCGSKWLGKKIAKLTVFQVKLLHNWLAQLLVKHQLEGDRNRNLKALTRNLPGIRYPGLVTGSQKSILIGNWLGTWFYQLTMFLA